MEACTHAHKKMNKAVEDYSVSLILRNKLFRVREMIELLGKTVSGIMLSLFVFSMLTLTFNIPYGRANDSWVWVSDTVTGAYGEAVVGTGDFIYIARKNSFYLYDPADNSWTALATPPNPDSGDAFKTGATLAWDFSNYIYALYGAATSDSRRWFYRYSISSNTWQGLANTIADQGEGDAITWVASENCTYATIGGEQRSIHLMRYDPSTDSWSDSPADPPAGMGDGASLVWTGDEFLYALRGEFIETSPLYNFWRYSLTENTWAEMAEIPADGHSGGTGGVGDGGSLLYVGAWLQNQTDYIYALSGNQACPDGIPDNRTYRYSVSMNSWERLADLPFGVGYYVGCRLGYADTHIYAWQGTPSTWEAGGDDLAYYVFPTSEANNDSTGHVVINEVELNPPGNDNYLSVEEWVELYNPTTGVVDISGWKMSTTHGTTVTITIPQGTTIPADGYYVYGRGSQWLDNNDESVVLEDSGGIEVDSTPIKSDDDNDDWSWQRYPNGQDSWHFQPSTKGSTNGGETPQEYLERLFNPLRGLCRETLIGELHNITASNGTVYARYTNETYWVASDNYLASLALNLYNQTLSEEINQTIHTYHEGVYYPYQIMQGKPIPITLHTPNIYVLENRSSHIITLNLYNGTIQALPHHNDTYLDYPSCGDALIYEAINYYIQGYPLSWAEGLYMKAYEMFNGIGVADSHFKNTSHYDNMKLALLIFGAKALDLDVNLTLIEQRLWLAQKTTGLEAGGITSVTDSDGNPVGTANCETTALTILAYNNEIIQKIRLKRSPGIKGFIEITYPCSTFNKTDQITTNLTAIPLLNNFKVTINNDILWAAQFNPRVGIGLFSSLASRENLSIQIVEYNNGRLDVVVHNSTCKNGCKISGVWYWSNPLTVSLLSNTLNVSSPSGTYTVNFTGFHLAYVTAGSTESHVCEDGKVTVNVTQAVFPELMIATAGGTTDPPPGNYTCDIGSPMTVTAINYSGYSFGHWLLDGEEKTENPITFTVDGNNTLQAFFVDDTAPTIYVLSPENKTYSTTSVPLNFTINESTSWMGYSLDGQSNVTITGNTTLRHLSEGGHNIIVYANDTAGNMRCSDTISFMVDTTLPTTTHDYDGKWHVTDFTITLMAVDYESGVAETYYTINDGTVKAISADGQPYITTENANNTLEYWSVDNAGNEESPHKILTGIKLDKTAPTIEAPSRIPEGDVQPDQDVKVSVNVTDFMSDTKNVTLSYNLNDSTIWTDLPMISNSTTGLYEYIILGQQANTLVKYKIVAYDNAGNYRVEDNNGQYYVYTVIPEFPSLIILPLFMIATLLAVIVYRRKRVHRLALIEGQKENKKGR